MSYRCVTILGVGWGGSGPPSDIHPLISAPVRSAGALAHVAGLPSDRPFSNEALQHAGAVPFGSGSASPCSAREAGTGVAWSGTEARCWGNINDGRKGDRDGWSPGHTGLKFVGVRLRKERLILYLSVGRDGLGVHTDRTSGRLQLQYTADDSAKHSTPGSSWHNYSSAFSLPSGSTTYWRLDPPVSVSAMRIFVDSPSIALDEIELFTEGRAAPGFASHTFANTNICCYR